MPCGSSGRPGFSAPPGWLWGATATCRAPAFWCPPRTIRENGGWPFHLLTEDIQFSVDCAVRGRRIGYCDRAVIYDEQPTTFRQSLDQRLRWSKGFYQVEAQYTPPPAPGDGPGGRRGWACYDMLMTVAPGMLLTLAVLLFNLLVCGAVLFEPTYVPGRWWPWPWTSCGPWCPASMWACSSTGC